MKLIYFLCISFFFTASLAAQYEKGNWYLDGNSSALLSVPLDNDRFATNFDAQAFRAGYFFTDRLLVGSRVGMSGYSGNNFSEGGFDVELRPFARYYFPGGDKRKVSYFGEVGFGTITPFSSNGSFETDFHFGGGAEVELLPGVVGTALLRYDANSSGLNVTNLTFGLNLLLGQLDNSEGGATVSKGAFTTTGSFGGLYFGRQGFSGESDLIGGAYFDPSIGYFLADGLMAEARFSTSYLRLKDIRGSGQGTAEVRNSNILNSSLELNLRYYLKKSGSLLPYITGGGGYQMYRSKTDGGAFGERKVELNSLFYQAGAGASWFLSPNVALDGSVLYRSEKNEAPNFGIDDKKKVVQAELGLRFFLRD